MDHFPTANQIRHWFVNFLTQVGSASCLGKDIYPYFQKAYNMEVPFEDLTVEPQHASIDSKVSECFIKLAGKHLGQKSIHFNLAHDLMMKAEEMIIQGSAISGLQCVRMIIKSCETQEDRGFLFDISDIQAIKFEGDEKLDLFKHSWDYTVRGQRVTQPPENYATWLYEKLKASRALEFEWRQWDKMPLSDPNKTYDFLYSALCSHLLKVTREKNRASQQSRQEHPSMNAAIVGPSPAGPDKDKRQLENQLKQAKDNLANMKSALAAACVPHPKAKAKAKGGHAKANAREKAKHPNLGDFQKADWESCREKGYCMNYQRGKCNKSSSECVHKH